MSQANSFFKTKQYSKCSNCLIEKRKAIKVNSKSDTSIIHQQGRGDIHFIFEMPELNNYKSKFINIYLKIVHFN